MSATRVNRLISCGAICLALLIGTAAAEYRRPLRPTHRDPVAVVPASKASAAWSRATPAENRDDMFEESAAVRAIDAAQLVSLRRHTDREAAQQASILPWSAVGGAGGVLGCGPGDGRWAPLVEEEVCEALGRGRSAQSRERTVLLLRGIIVADGVRGGAGASPVFQRNRRQQSTGPHNREMKSLLRERAGQAAGNVISPIVRRRPRQCLQDFRPQSAF